MGLGNPGGEYDGSRHNAGRDALRVLSEREGFSEWKAHPASESLITKGELGGADITLVLPETFMNKSGRTAGKLVKSAKAAERLVVLHDDLDLPLGKWKFSFGRGSGGHKGVESVQRALKTKDLVRVRIGISPTAFLTGKLKKPKGEDAVVASVLGKFTPSERKDVERVFGEIREALTLMAKKGLDIAMNEWNKR